MKDVISLIKHGDRENYELLCDRVSYINKRQSCGGFYGGCFEYDHPDTIFIGNDEGSIGLVSAIVVHEVCHADQFYSGRDLNEPECYKAGSDFLEKVTQY